MATSDALFREADSNNDGYLSQDEFRSFVSRNSTAGLGTSNLPAGIDFNNLGAGTGYDSSFFRSGSYETTTTGGTSDADLVYANSDLQGVNYSSSSFQSTAGNVGNEFSNLNLTDTTQISNTDATLAGSTTTSQASFVQQYETDAQGNYKDSNPQVIRRPAQNGPVSYTQNIQVRFLRPPPVPPPGPLIIKEVRPPQPPLPPPLRVRQQAPPLPQPPPLVLRERPPPKPATVASQTVVRNLPPIPVPPRSVVIERSPPMPPKPRDIVIERWVPYGPQAKRRTIVQHAATAKSYPAPRNIIIEYDPPQVRVLRKFQRLGISQGNPDEYIQQYGASLLDTQNLVQQARAAGVVEDISVPEVSSSVDVTTSESSSSTGGANFQLNNGGRLNLGALTGGSSNNGGVSRSSFYESSSYSTNGDTSGLGLGRGGFQSSTNDFYSYNSPVTGLTDATDALFAAADTNNDDVLTQAEFRKAGF